MMRWLIALVATLLHSNQSFKEALAVHRQGSQLKSSASSNLIRLVDGFLEDKNGG